MGNKYSITAHPHKICASLLFCTPFKLGQAWHMLGFKAIKLNFTFKSHTPYPSNEALNTKQACSLHPKLFHIVLQGVIQMQVWPTGLSLHRARVILITFICCFPQWSLSSQQQASLIKLPNCIDSLTAESKMECCSVPKVPSGIHHTYLRLLHSQIVADYMWLHKHVQDTQQDTLSREFEDKLHVSLPFSTAAPGVSVALKIGDPVLREDQCLGQSNPEYLPGTWISNLRTESSSG